MRIKTTNHKRGDTFSRIVLVTEAGVPMDLSGYTVASEVRTIDYALVDALTIDMTNASLGQIGISEADTSAWPLSDIERPLLCDVKFVSGDTNRTETFGIIVEREVTG